MGFGKRKQYLTYNATIKSARLPSAYQEVEYIQSSGAQYIDSNYIPTANTKTQVTCTFTKKGSNYMGITGYETNGRNTFGIDNNGYSYFGVANQNNFGTIDVMSQKLTWEIDNVNKTYTNGIYNGSWSATYTNSQSLHFYFFVRCDVENGVMQPQNTEIGYGWLQLYEAKFYESNVLTAHFIPCYRKSDNEVGMYDLVNGVFYTNEGSGEFTCGVPIIYDSRYQQVEYIQTSGTQCINTGLKWNDTMDIDYDFVPLSKSGDVDLFGLWDGANYDTGWLIGWTGNSYLRCISGLGINAGFNPSNQGTISCLIPSNSSYYVVGTRYLFKMTMTNNVVSFKANGNTISIYNTQTATSSTSITMPSCLTTYANIDIYLFSRKATYGFSQAKLYNCKFYQNGTLVRDFIPCYRKSDNEIGLLDIVNDVFYTNEGSGTLTAGGNL